MKGDIKNTTKIYQYPRVEEFNSITPDEIVKFIEDNKDFRNKYLTNLDYYIGRNTFITDKETTSYQNENPDSRVTTPYARTMTQSVKGYMYKTGLITYSSEDETYMKQLQEIFDKNLEELKTSENGENQSKYGLGVELLYTDRAMDDGGVMPFFTSVKPEECIFIFNMDIEAKLIGTIRYYIINEDEMKQSRTWHVEVYFVDRVEVYSMTEKNYVSSKDINKTGKLEPPKQIEKYPNFYQDIPFVLYINNQEYHPDYEPVKTLIDAYDNLMSDSTNELNRFASSYLLLYNFILSNVEDPAEKKKKLEELKSKRVMEFITTETAKTGAEFLTRDIPTDFMEALKGTLREDIQYHSHIPDFREKNFQSASGEAMKWALFDFENLCGDKQSQFEIGLQRRIQLINNFLSIKGITTDKKVNISFSRNLPSNNESIINSIVQLKAAGIVADELLLKMLEDIGIIDDVDTALAKLKKQKEENMALMPDNIEEPDEEEDL